MQNFNTHAVAKVVVNNKAQTYRLLVAFNTTAVTVLNASYTSSDCSPTQLVNAMYSAMQNLRITKMPPVIASPNTTQMRKMPPSHHEALANVLCALQNLQQH